eukprot:4056543-Pyramimonas_sp.AAC.1
MYISGPWGPWGLWGPWGPWGPWELLPLTNRLPSPIQVEEQLSDVSVSKSAAGLISFSFRRPLAGEGDIPPVDPLRPLPLGWALGPSWSDAALTGQMEHTDWSRSATSVTLSTGEASVAAVDSAYSAHGQKGATDDRLTDDRLTDDWLTGDWRTGD